MGPAGVVWCEISRRAKSTIRAAKKTTKVIVRRIVVTIQESGFWNPDVRNTDDKLKFVGYHDLQVPLRKHVAMMSHVAGNDVSKRIHSEGVVARDSCPHPGVSR